MDCYKFCIELLNRYKNGDGQIVAVSLFARVDDINHNISLVLVHSEKMLYFYIFHTHFR